MTIFRGFFEKRGEAAYISHLDLQRAVMRAMRIAKLPVWYTQGYNPRIYLAFALPLSLGQEGLDESFDFKSDAALFSQEEIERLNAALPLGVRVKEIVPAQSKIAAIAWANYAFRYPGLSHWQYEQLLQRCHDTKEIVIHRKRKSGGLVPMNVTPYLYTTRLDAVSFAPGQRQETALVLTLPAGNEGYINPELMHEAITEQVLANDSQGGDQDWVPAKPLSTLQILRLRVLTADGKDFR